MNIPESWLRSFCAPQLSGAELAERLTMAGLEVEAYEPVGPPFSGVVVGQILEVARHPNADKLTVCTVDAGGEKLKVVCGAPNARAGMKAPLAKIGARLPAVQVQKTTIRGVESAGMLCSARELGLSEDHSGLLELQGKVGSDARAVLGLDEHVFTLKLTPNRADCLSVLGVAREVAALTGAPLESPRIEKVPARSDARHPLRISAPEGCGRFAGRLLRDVNAAAPTPSWMKSRLERSGQRSISALVDVTNYVMLELGRPLHVYDVDKLAGAIDVRWGRKGEKVLLLNEQEVEVDPSVLCITDDSGAIGLGGIMGGESTKADEATRHVFLESAFFWPDAVAGRARRYNFTSDASHRFERGVDFNNNVDGIERATRLILDICGGEPGPTDDLVAKLPQRKPVRMRVARAQKIIGMPLAAEEMQQTFERLALPHKRESEAFVVNPPSYRFDLAIEEDLIEEVARLYGFERIAAHPPRPAATFLKAPEKRSLHELRERLAAADYRELINFTFVEPQWELDFGAEANPVRLLNPIVSQQSVMRSSLIGSLVANLRYNQARKVERIRVFEIGRVFVRDPQAPEGPLAVRGLRQPMRVGAAAYGPALEEQWAAETRAVDFFDVKADLEALISPLIARYERAEHPAFHPGRAARVMVEGEAAGWIGELHPRWQQKYELARPAVLFELDAERLQAVPPPAFFSAPSKYPPVVRDMALVVDASVPAQALLDAMAAKKPAIVASIRLFDLYQGQGVPAGRKSLAFRVVMQHTERTLTDAEADAAREALVSLLGQEFSASLRK